MDNMLSKNEAVIVDSKRIIHNFALFVLLSFVRPYGIVNENIRYKWTQNDRLKRSI